MTNPTPDNSSENREASVEARARELLALTLEEFDEYSRAANVRRKVAATVGINAAIRAIIAALTQSNASPDDAVAAEREACAKVAEELDDPIIWNAPDGTSINDATRQRFAAAIRARKPASPEGI